MNPQLYRHYQRHYSEEFGFPLLVTNAKGQILHEKAESTDCACENTSNEKRIQAARQTLVWGEPVIGMCCGSGYATWAVPLMHNAEITGALLVQGIDLESGEPELSKRIRKAAQGLLNLAIKENLTNAAALEIANEKAARERDRFLLIEASKEGWAKDDLRSIYLSEETGLLTAIKEGQIHDARAVLNRILTSIYSVANENMDLLKSCILELVVMMSRAAVEAGADPKLILGSNYRFITDLAPIADEEDLSVWVRNMLEALIESIHKSEAYPHFMVLNKALSYMETHLQEPLKRNEVAKLIGVSPSHFSKIMTNRLGRSFTELLNQMRISRAKQLILRTEYNLTSIALECGFFDQSHFSKNFRKATGIAPGEYRRRMAPTAS